jgi:ribose-phosphate pyrophosphokinase
MSLPLLLATATYQSLSDDLCGLGAAEAGQRVVEVFPDGERYIRIDTPLDGRDVLVLGGTVSDTDTLELFDLACAAVSWGAQRLTLLVPYFGCATMERAIKPGEAVTAKYRARLLSAVPAAPGGNRVFMVDLHAAGIPHYFDAHVRTVHVYAKPVISRLCRQLGGDDFVLACTDAGRAKWVESLANDMAVPASFVFKRRLDGSRTEVTAVSAQVADKPVVIYDDMIRTGGSLLGAAAAYRDAGASRVCAVTTHGVFPDGAVERIRDSGLIEHIACTDSHPRAAAVARDHPDFITIASLSPVLGAALAAHP